MTDPRSTIEAEAQILKLIDEQVKTLSPEIRSEAFQILVRRHLTKEQVPQPVIQAGVKATTKKAHRSKSGSDVAVVRDLDLKKDENGPSLRDFYGEKKPGSFVEHNTLFVFYLNRTKFIEDVTPSHVYTCYKEVGARIPGAFYQSLLDTSRKGWIDTRDTAKIRVTTVGENFVEHDLPNKSGAK
jgi:hypothetical protein